MCKSLHDILFYKIAVDERCYVDNILIFEDHQSAIICVKNEIICGKLKHLDVKLKHIREVLSANNIHVKFISTELQIADLFIKCLPKNKLTKLLISVCLLID